MESEWRQNIRKMSRNEGQEYTTRKGTLVQARYTIYHRCGRCVNKCNDILSDDDRDTICQNYWKMGDMQRQRYYIVNHVVIKENSRKTPGSRRNMSLHYFFTVRDKRVKVCKAVSLKTLCIGEKTVTYTISHRSDTGQSGKDGRGNKPPGIKKSDVIREAVKSHIHHQRKNRVRQVKLEYKELAKTDPEVVSLTFDLQQVLHCPKLNVSSLFYRRTLATYNLTTYDLDSHRVNCFMWHEGEGGRGSSEIATCMHHYLKSLPDHIKRVFLFSDTCSAKTGTSSFPQCVSMQ